MTRRRYLQVRAATGQRETLPVAHDETAHDLLLTLREWAVAQGVDDVWFRIDEREYRFFLDSEPQEIS